MGLRGKTSFIPPGITIIIIDVIVDGTTGGIIIIMIIMIVSEVISFLLLLVLAILAAIGHTYNVMLSALSMLTCSHLSASKNAKVQHR